MGEQLNGGKHRVISFIPLFLTVKIKQAIKICDTDETRVSFFKIFY